MRKKIKCGIALLLGMVLVIGGVQLPIIDVSAEDSSHIMTSLDSVSNVIEVTNEDEFVAALTESSAEVICLTEPVTLSRSDDGKDNVFVISRQVTITGEALSLERAGIVLGADVVFQNITLCFNTSVRNAIIANGYSLTINNVISGGTYSIDLFCGGITDYTGGNDIPQVGSNGKITMKGTNTIGTNIYAGSLSDVGYADENGKLYEDRPNIYAGDATIILENGATGFNNIYAHGAREDRSGGHANEWFASDSLYAVSGNVDIELNSNKKVFIDGATGGSKNATFIYKDTGNGYICEPTLNNVADIMLLPSGNEAVTYLAPNTSQTNFNTLSVPANTRLSLINMGAELSAKSFEGGGELVFADSSQKLDLAAASGMTQIAVGGVDSYGTGSTGNINSGWTCITVADAESESEFVLMPNFNAPNMILKKNESGNWITGLEENSVCISDIAIKNVIATEDNYGIDVPIDVIYATQDEMNFLGDVPIKISVNGKETFKDTELQGYFTGTTDSDLMMFFDFGDDGEILRIINYDWDVYVVPEGRYEIAMTIPANNMADKNEYVISFVLTVESNEHTGETVMRPEIGTVSAENIYDTTDVSLVTLSRSDETIAGMLELTDNILQYGTYDYNWKFTPEDTDKYEIITGKVEITVIDTKAPTASYQIGTGSVREFLNEDSYDLFFNSYQEVIINFNDEESGVATKQYYISDVPIEDTSNVEWKEYAGRIYLNEENTYFIYVKVTDNYGNTVVLNSEGIVIYTESELNTEITGYTYRHDKDVFIQINANGNTFAKLTYDNGDEIDKDAYVIEENGALTLKSEYIDTLKRGEYTYVIHMNPQGIETTEAAISYSFVLNVKKYLLKIGEIKRNFS